MAPRGEMQPGFGERHPMLAPILAEHQPLGTRETAWMNGEMPLRVCAYAGEEPRLPRELITSVRCLVSVGDRIVYCENDDGGHPWPGGRREGSESAVDTATREVHEETGWRLEAESVKQLGWLLLTHLAPVPPDYHYPNPDFVQLVMQANAIRRDVEQDASWADADGYERGSALLSVDRAIRQPGIDPLSLVFLRML